jgi:hypothetical protein
LIDAASSSGIMSNAKYVVKDVIKPAMLSFQIKYSGVCAERLSWPRK